MITPHESPTATCMCKVPLPRRTPHPRRTHPHASFCSVPHLDCADSLTVLPLPLQLPLSLSPTSSPASQPRISVGTRGCVHGSGEMRKGKKRKSDGSGGVASGCSRAAYIDCIVRLRAGACVTLSRRIKRADDEYQLPTEVRNRPYPPSLSSASTCTMAPTH